MAALERTRARAALHAGLRRIRLRARARVLGALLAALGAPAFLIGIDAAQNGGSSSAAAQASAAEPTAQTDNSIPARGVMMLGSSPDEAPGETWGIGTVGSPPAWTIVRYAAGAGWSVAPAPLRSDGQPLTGFEPARNVLAGQTTPNGSGALLGTVSEGEGQATTRKVLLVRDPGGAFKEAPAVPEGMLKPGEALYGQTRTPQVAALQEGANAGALVVPVNPAPEAAEDGVLHRDGSAWTREPIEGLPSPSAGFRVLALAASSPRNAWLLAQLPGPAHQVALFDRHTDSPGPRWLPVALAPGQTAASPQPLHAPVTGGSGEAAVTVTGAGEPPTNDTQALTVSDEGVWVDGVRADVGAPVSVYFQPDAADAAGGGELRASWCNADQAQPQCTYTLPDKLPSGPHRSFAWADPSNPQRFGQRVITGLLEGVTLRLEGASFARVLGLGGWEPDVGGSLGAAFSNPREGWLGSQLLPLHLTLSPAPNRLAPYPVPFRSGLLAIAPQPGAPVGSLSSQALGVGDQGEVARYRPGQGWLPESLLMEGGRHVTPTLRGVAWPMPGRAYAVGQLDRRGDPQMWLWRAETGLWEPDLAMPLNFRGNLLGIAFDPNNPSRGYAVGQQGVLLRYGKSWTQDVLPPEVQGASFTSIAFAGSQAIVAYRVPHLQGGGRGARYTGGLLVNDGSGWRVDQDAAQALGTAVPWAVAGLPDGGAALSAEEGERPLIAERDGLGASWARTAATYAGFEVPSSLALFREGGQLRVVTSGTAPNTLEIDTGELPPPAGFPPNLIKPYPAAGGYVIRQTAAGWSDEEHDRNSAQDPPGEYKAYDSVYQPDPTSAVLIDQTGTQGWTVGGVVDAESPTHDTADVSRYPADGVPPPGFATAPVQTSPGLATFAVGGNAQCLAPCADRANAGVGPDVWLSDALAHASQIAGVRAFLYTGPGVTSGIGQGNFPVRYEAEFGRYASVLASSPLAAYAAAAPSDRAPGSECGFTQAFSGFPQPFGAGAPAPGLANAGRSSEECGQSAQSAYYALDSSSPAGDVRVIMLDDSDDVGATQQAWLAGELAGAQAQEEPAIVVGYADLNAQIAAEDVAASQVAQILAAGGASAYFYDAPEQNVTLPLRVGATSIPTFGSGTLGYVSAINAAKPNFIGHSGFLLAQVNVAARNPQTSRAPVSARLIPNIGELAMEATDGVLLRRSRAALFEGLARRPRAGGRSSRGANVNESAPYIPIPANCVGAACANAILPEYRFSSSRPDIGDFVRPNTAVSDPHTVLLGPNGKPIPDPTSGLFCAYNAGNTVVTISAGGFAASLTVAVQAGSVRRPCGTQPLAEVSTQAQATVPPPAPAPAPAPSGPAPASTPPPVPVPPPPAQAPPPVSTKPAAPSFFLPPTLPAPVLAFVPPPLPTPARPTPPSGTSAVTSPVEIAEQEEEEEEAPESVSNKAVAYRHDDHTPYSVYLLGMIVLAAFAGASARRAGRGRREVRVAAATLSAERPRRRDGASRRRL